MLDAQWIQRLHAYGLLRPSFRPPDPVLALRGHKVPRVVSLLKEVRNSLAHLQIVGTDLLNHGDLTRPL